MANLYLDLAAHIKPFLGIGPLDITKDTALNLINKVCCARLDTILRVTTLAKHVVTGEIVEGGKSKIVTKDFPIISIEAITQGSLATPYTQTASYIFRKNVIYLDGYLGGGIGNTYYEDCKINYTAGYVTFAQNAAGTYVGQPITFPDDLQLALLMMVGSIFNQKQNQGIESYNLHRTQVVFRDKQESDQFQAIINGYKKSFIHGI